MERAKVNHRMAILLLLSTILVFWVPRGPTGQAGMSTRSSVAAAQAAPPFLPGRDVVEQAAWQIEVVYEYGGAGLSLALDQLGQPHISHFGHDGSFLYGVFYTEYENFGWTTEMVDEEGNGHTSLELDSLEEPHIAYHSSMGAQDKLRYAHYYDGSWHIQDVDNTGGVSTDIALALDSVDLPHVVYSDEAGTAIRYARRTGGGSWEMETVVAFTGTGQLTEYDLALDSSDRPHISYYDYDVGALKYAYFDGATWHFQTVDEGNMSTGQDNSLVLDSQGHPHIAYRDLALKYAHHDGSSWQITVVDNDFFAGSHASIALDSGQRPHISYADWATPDQELRYAYFDGFDWQIQTVDTAGETSRYEPTSLALDGSDRPHMAYEDLTPHQLKYAVYREPCTPLTTVSIAGPARLPVGIGGSYTATYDPPEASPPVLYAWDNGTVEAVTSYTWTITGTYTVEVTATNACGQDHSSYLVETFCQPLTGLEVDGPLGLLVNQSGTYWAVAQPITASPPLTFTWDNGSVGPSTTFSWPATGTYSITVGGTNPCQDDLVASVQVQVFTEWPYVTYLPLVARW